MNLKELERIIEKVETNLFRNSNSYSIGMLKSSFKGVGIQFKEHQVYNPGDDVRFIDWKLSAKTNHTFVKTFEEERNVEIVVVIDVTESMLTGYKNVSKLQACIEIACLLNLLADRSKDKVSTIFFLDDVNFLPVSVGHKGMATIFSFLEKRNLITTSGSIDVTKNFNFEMSEKKKLSILKSLVAKRKEVVFLSDFSQIEDIKTLENLVYRRNMHCFRVVGPLDTSTKLPYSVFGKQVKKTMITKSKTNSDKFDALKGRWHLLSVKERYLETFIREMV